MTGLTLAGCDVTMSCLLTRRRVTTDWRLLSDSWVTPTLTLAAPGSSEVRCQTQDPVRGGPGLLAEEGRIRYHVTQCRKDEMFQNIYMTFCGEGDKELYQYWLAFEVREEALPTMRWNILLLLHKSFELTDPLIYIIHISPTVSETLSILLT